MKSATNWVSESTVATVRSTDLAEAEIVAGCGSADGTSLDLTTEMVTVLGADVRSSEFVAEYLRATHMYEQRGARTCANEEATHMYHTHVRTKRATRLREQRGHTRVNKEGFADTYLKMLVVSSSRLG